MSTKLKMSTDYAEFGYDIFGPVILGFTKWIKENIKKDNKKIFLARDGYYIKKAYEIMYPDEDSGVYLYASRKAFKIPFIQYTNGLNELSELINLPSVYTVVDLAGALGIKDSNIKINKGKKYTEFYFYKYPELKDFVQENLDSVIDNSKTQANNLIEYLRQEGVDGNCSIIDIGWRGSMQYYLQKFACHNNIDLSIDGYYVGLIAQAKTYNIDAKGYWFDMLNNADDSDLATPFQGLLEILFSVNEGTTIGYEKSNSSIHPILASYEYGEIDSLKEQGQILTLIRESALLFVKDCVQNGLEEFDDFNATNSFNNLKNVGLNPSLRETNLLGDLVFIDQTANELAKPKNLLIYVIRPKQFKYDLLNSRWKVGFMKRFLKLPFNYYKIYQIMK